MLGAPSAPGSGSPPADRPGSQSSPAIEAENSQLPEGRILELIADAQQIAGPQGAILVRPDTSPHSDVHAGSGLRLPGRIASRYFLVSPTRYAAGLGGQPYRAESEARDSALRDETELAAQILERAQLTRMSGREDARAPLITLLNRNAMRGNGLCIVAPAFDESLLAELLARHHSQELQCPAFCVDESARDELRRLCFRNTTGFFAAQSSAVSLFFDAIEVRSDELLVFYQGAGGAGLPPAAQLVIGRASPEKTQAAVAEVRRLLRDTGG